MTVILKPKAQVGTQDYDQQETVVRANTKTVGNEKIMMLKAQAEENINKIILKAPQISKELGGDYEDRMKQERSIHLVMTLDARPEVVLTGFWNGKLIQAAQNAIARAYRIRRITVLKQ